MKNVFFKLKTFFYLLSILEMVLIDVLLLAMMFFLARLGIPAIDYVVLFIGIPMIVLLGLVEDITLIKRRWRVPLL